MILIQDPLWQSNGVFLNNLRKTIGFVVNTYDNYLIMFDFNMEPSESFLK